MNDIFGGNATISTVYSPANTDSLLVSIAISTGSGASDTNNPNQGFLVQRFQAAFMRPVQMQRMLNVPGRVAILGYGDGQLDLSGLVGTADGFNALTSADAAKCQFASITIRAGAGTQFCSTNGTTQDAGSPVIIRCEGSIMQGVTLGMSAETNGIMLQSGSVSYKIIKLSVASA